MKIVHISTADNKGGAARAAFQLHLGLLEAGHESLMLVGQRWEDRPEIARVGWPQTILGRIGTRLVLEFETQSGLQYLLTPWKNSIVRHPFLENADVIHLHNLHGNFFTPLILPKLSKIAPMVWTLHDTWSMTGHCTYTYDCERWRTGCGHCPNLTEHPKISLDTTAMLWRVRQRVYADSRITVAAPSKWLAGMASESPLLNRFNVHHIPYGFDLTRLSPVDKSAARRELGIPQDALVVMTTVLVGTGAERKGAAYFMEALPQIKAGQKIHLLVVGSKGALGKPPEGFTMIETGYMKGVAEMVKCYSASDMYVLPTIADNLPLSLIEASSCGVPSVAFNIGGVPDIIQHMETGYLAAHKDSTDLAAGIRTLAADRSVRESMGKRARERAVGEYASAVQVRRYENLYRSL